MIDFIHADTARHYFYLKNERLHERVAQNYSNLSIRFLAVPIGAATVFYKSLAVIGQIAESAFKGFGNLLQCHFERGVRMVALGSLYPLAKSPFSFLCILGEGFFQFAVCLVRPNLLKESIEKRQEKAHFQMITWNLEAKKGKPDYRKGRFMKFFTRMATEKIAITALQSFSSLQKALKEKHPMEKYDFIPEEKNPDNGENLFDDYHLLAIDKNPSAALLLHKERFTVEAKYLGEYFVIAKVWDTVNQHSLTIVSGSRFDLRRLNEQISKKPFDADYTILGTDLSSNTFVPNDLSKRLEFFREELLFSGGREEVLTGPGKRPTTHVFVRSKKPFDCPIHLSAQSLVLGKAVGDAPNPSAYAPLFTTVRFSASP